MDLGLWDFHVECEYGKGEGDVQYPRLMDSGDQTRVPSSHNVPQPTTPGRETEKRDIRGEHRALIARETFTDIPWLIHEAAVGDHHPFRPQNSTGQQHR